MALFCNFGATSLKSFVRRTIVDLSAMSLISLNLKKIKHFWSGNYPVPSTKSWMETIYFNGTEQGE